MIPVLTGSLLVALAVVAALALVATLRSRPVDNPMFYAVAVLEVLLLAQLIVGIVRRAEAPHGLSTGLWVSYLGGMLVVPPAAFFWALGERESRWGTGVLAVAALGLLVMVGRLVQIWNG